MENVFGSVWGFLAQYGLVAFFILLFIEEAGIPIPVTGDLILLFVGYQVAHGVQSGPVVFLLSTLAVVLGATTLYVIIRRGGRALVERYQGVLRLSPKRLEQIERWFQEHGAYIVIVSRFVPGFRIYTSAVAGLFRLPYRFFGVQVLISGILWSGTLLWLGYSLGERWAVAADTIARYSPIIAGVAIVGITAYLLVRFVRRRNGASE